MSFRRRTPAGNLQKLRDLVWPRKGWMRPFRHVAIRVLRLSASPHAIAAGVAAGVVASWTPFIGFHFLIAFAVCYLLAGNMVAAALGTAFGNPLTFPFIWASTWEVGNRMLGAHSARSGGPMNLHALFERLDLSQLWGPVLKPMLLGALPLAAVSGVLLYFLTYSAVSGFQSRRRARLKPQAATAARSRVGGATGV